MHRLKPVMNTTKKVRESEEFNYSLDSFIGSDFNSSIMKSASKNDSFVKGLMRDVSIISDLNPQDTNVFNTPNKFSTFSNKAPIKRMLSPCKHINVNNYPELFTEIVLKPSKRS